VNDETRFRLALLTLLVVALVWVGSTVGTLVYACQPGNAPAILLAGLVGLVGYGLTREGFSWVTHMA